MTPTVWSGAILVAAAAGLLALRALSRRIRIAFDIVCLIALSVVLHERGASPFLGSSVAPDIAPLWLRFLIAAWWLASARLVVGVLYFALRHDRSHRSAKLVVDLIAAAIYVGTGVIVLKSVLDLPVTGLFATSGVVAIVLGLALQSTLADVFSGIAVGIEAPFQVDDRISLGADIEGRVIETNWRSIRVQTDGDDIAIIPNSVMAKLQIVNRSVPSRRRTVSAEVPCPATVDPAYVIQVLDEATLLCPAILDTPASSVALTRLGRRWNHYTISFSVAETSLTSGTKSLLLGYARKQMHYAGLLQQNPGGLAQPPARSRPMILAPREVLADLVLFERLQPIQLEDLASRLTTRLLEPGETLFAQDATDATLYVVASGVLEMTRATGKTTSLTLGRIGAGEYIGEIGLLAESPHESTARARTHCVVYQLRRDAIAGLLETNAEVAAALEKAVRRGLELVSRKVAATAAGDVGIRGQLVQRIRRFFRSAAG